MAPGLVVVVTLDMSRCRVRRPGQHGASGFDREGLAPKRRKLCRKRLERLGTGYDGVRLRGVRDHEPPRQDDQVRPRTSSSSGWVRPWDLNPEPAESASAVQRSSYLFKTVQNVPQLLGSSFTGVRGCPVTRCSIRAAPLLAPPERLSRRYKAVPERQIGEGTVFAVGTGRRTCRARRSRSASPRRPLG